MHDEKRAVVKDGKNKADHRWTEGVEISAARWKTEGNGMPLFTLVEILRRVTEGFPRAVIRKQGEGPVTGVRALVEYGESGQVDSVIVTLL